MALPRKALLHPTIFAILTLLAFLVNRTNAVFIAYGIYLTYRITGPLLSPRSFTTGLYRFITASLLYGLILQCIIIVAWALSPDAPLHLAPLVTLFFCLGMYALLWRKSAPAGTLPALNKLDVTALFLALAASLMIVTPAILKGGYKPENVVRLVNANVDDAAHLSLFNDHLDSDRGILTNTTSTGDLRNFTMYPAGWHSMNVLLVSAISPKISSGSQTLVAYAITKVLWFMVMLYLAFRLGLQLVGTYSKKTLDGGTCIAFSLISLYFLQVFVHVFIEGFYSFIPQIIYGLVMIALASQLLKAEDKAARENFVNTFPLIFMLSTAGSLGWVLPLPALIVFIVALGFAYLCGKSWLHNLVSLVRDSRALLPLYVLATGAVLVQFYVLSVDKSPGAVSFTQGLLLTGGITIYNFSFYIVLGLGLAAFLVAARKIRTNNNFLDALLILAISLGVFVSAVYGYQQLRINGNAYYYYKLLYLAIALATPLAVSGIVLAIQIITRSSIRVAALALAILCAFVNIVGIEPTLTRHPLYTYPSYFVARRKVTNAYDKVIYDNLSHVSTKGNYNDNAYYFFYTLGGPQIDTAILLLKSNKPTTPCFETVRSAIITDKNILATDDIAQQNCKGKQVYAIMSSQDLQSLSGQKLNKLNLITYAQAAGQVPLQR